MTETCKHPPTRQYAWHAHDGTLVICCCDCGAVLQGAADAAADADAEDREYARWDACQL